MAASPETVQDQADELAALIPALADALSRDNSPSDGRSKLAAGGVVNADVLHAMIALRGEIPAVHAVACQLASEPCGARPLGTCLRALPRLHGRLADIGMPGASARIESSLSRWLRAVKLALGLRTPDMPIGFDCPLHEEACPLVAIGSEGFLLPGRTVLWQHAGQIWCGMCGESWPADQWLHLGRLLMSA